MEKGYQFVKVYDFYEWDVTKYDPGTVPGGLFAEYTDIFRKLKAEASYYPYWVQC